MVTPEAGSYTDNQDKSAWYYSAVETAYANGAITRQTDTFRPREPITREELAVANAVPTALPNGHSPVRFLAGHAYSDVGTLFLERR